MIQARLGSTRLPRKVLADIGGAPMLCHVVERAKRIGYPVLVAIPFEDSELVRLVECQHFFGPADDVLLRYMQAAQAVKADHVIRVTADCPLLDPEAARYTAMHHLETGADFTYYLAEGRSVEVFTRSALERAEKHAKGTQYREHPDEWLMAHGPAEGLRIEEVKFSVDTQEDLERIRRWMT